MNDIVERLKRDATCSSHHEAAAEIEWLRAERNRLASDLSKAHGDVVQWIENSNRLAAVRIVSMAALRMIGMPGKDIGYCRDGHEMAVLIARDALRESEI